MNKAIDENPDDLPFQSTHDVNLLDVQLLNTKAKPVQRTNGGEDSTPSWITSHGFAKGEQNEFLCKHCNLAEAAHAEVTDGHVMVGNWRCPDCVKKDVECSHTRVVKFEGSPLERVVLYQERFSSAAQ